MPDKPAFRPLYRQVKERLLRRLAAGEWPPGTFLPSETALAREYEVSQGTLRKALNELTREGVVERFQGRGTAVPTFDSDQYLYRFFRLTRLGGGRDLPMSQLLGMRREKASRLVAGHLGIEPGAPTLRLERIRVLAGRPCINQRIWLPCVCFPGIENIPASAIPNTLYDFYQKRFGVTIARATEWLRAVVADATDAKRLRVPVGHPLLALRRVALDLQDRPVELRLSHCRTDEHEYQSDLR